MIKIQGIPLNLKEAKLNYAVNSVEELTVKTMQESKNIYNYNSLDELKLDLNLKAQVVKCSRELDEGEMDFKIFTKSRCNKKFWDRRNDGGFILKEGVEPYDAIMDIYKNGDKYGTECATAIIIVYYGALANTLGRETFNKIYTEIELMNWQNVDENMGLNEFNRGKDLIPGDCKYFKNPDVNPKTPEWQGENTIYLGDGKYFGHGAGIMTANEMVEKLNKKRRKGATETAYLMDNTTAIDGRYIYYLKNEY